MAIVRAIIVLIFVVCTLVWLVRRWRGQGSTKPQLIDPSDSYQIGVLIGLTGGSVADAAVARYALERFEKEYGRKATTEDMGLVLGLMRSGL